MKYEEKALTHEMCLRVQNDLMPYDSHQSQGIKQGCGNSSDGMKSMKHPLANCIYVQTVLMFKKWVEMDIFRS